MAEPIEIIIRQGGQGGAGLGSGTGGLFNRNRKKTDDGIPIGAEASILNNPIAKKSTKAAVSFMISSMKGAVSYSINNYGNMTGDYIGQQNINEAMSVVSDLLSIGTSTATAAMINPILAPVAFGVAAGSAVINKVNQWRSFNLSVSKQNTQADFMRERAYGTLGSGSRGTNE